jgi:flagellar basal-body rod protein FlgG
MEGAAVFSYIVVIHGLTVTFERFGINGTALANGKSGGISMLKGIYKAASGMIPRVRQQETRANNIANAATPGFKKDSIFLKELTAAQRATLPRRSDWQTPMIDQVYTDYTQGAFRRTDNTLDVAIEGNGFFVVENPEGGELQYTRNGSFSVDTEGFLISNEGLRVLGDGGPIEVGNGTVDVNESGEVLVDESVVARLQIADFSDKSAMVKVGSSGFIVPEEVEAEPATEYSIRQGFLEQANINVVKEMVGMIIALRHFESGAKALQSQDESLSTLFNQVGRTRL